MLPGLLPRLRAPGCRGRALFLSLLTPLAFGSLRAARRGGLHARASSPEPTPQGAQLSNGSVLVAYLTAAIPGALR